VNRLNPIEGLRAYLALWVLVGHVMAMAGYESGSLGGISWLLRENLNAVDVFVIVSGFVIFFLLDNKHESYWQFICRRFFRLYPVYILLFCVAIPISVLRQWDVEHSHQYLTPDLVDYFTREFNSEWQHWRGNIAWHLVMLHGIVPDPWLAKSTVVAFLGAAWSVSLEWQFYLVAPLAFFLAASARPIYRIGSCVFCLYLLVIADKIAIASPGAFMRYGAFLPFHVEFFFAGAASYFFYKQAHQCSRADAVFPVSICAAIFLWCLSEESQRLIPICLWIGFLGLLCESPGSLSAKMLWPLFNHPLAQFLGRISYSIYLSHELVMTVLQCGLLNIAPHLSRTAYFWVLLTATIAAAIIISALLYRFVEAPGMQLGRRLAMRLEPKPGAQT